MAINLKHHRAWGSGGLRGLRLPLSLLLLGGCEVAPFSTSASPTTIASNAGTVFAKPEESRMWMTVGERRFAITLTDNAASRAFDAQLPLTLDLAELNGNEKHGDLMLYGTRTLVVFYSTFDSPYSYTRLGRVDDPTSLAQALGRGDVRVVFSRNQ